MPRKPAAPRPRQDEEQLKRFKDMAREVEVDESSGGFDRAFDRVISGTKRKVAHGHPVGRKPDPDN
jgi:hypothetical protein